MIIIKGLEKLNNIRILNHNKKLSIMKGLQLFTLEKNIKGRYRISSSILDLPKLLMLSNIRRGHVFMDEIGFDSSRDRQDFIKSLAPLI